MTCNRIACACDGSCKRDDLPPLTWGRFTFPLMAQQGWVCPRCQKVNAPWMPSCSCLPTLSEPTA
jgi:hypothetical protein